MLQPTVLKEAGEQIRRAVRPEDFYVLTEEVFRASHLYSITITRPGGFSFRVDSEPNLDVAVLKILRSYNESP